MMQKLLDTSNYKYQFLKIGFKLDKIKDPEIRKFMNKAGFLPGDIIFKLNGEPMSNKSEDDISDVIEKLSKSPYVTVEILRNGKKMPKIRFRIDRNRRK